jgi:hypothetical protein
MIRKATIIVLSVAEVGILLLLLIACFSAFDLRLLEGSPLPQLRLSFAGRRVSIMYYSATTMPPSTPRGWWEGYGFSSATDYAVMTYSKPPSYGTAPFRLRRVEAPAWVLLILLVLFAAYPLRAFTRGPLRRHRRRKRGLCICCGYNLTGNVSGICPECGTSTQPTESPRSG